jgi:hypothetical protein
MVCGRRGEDPRRGDDPKRGEDPRRDDGPTLPPSQTETSPPLLPQQKPLDYPPFLWRPLRYPPPTLSRPPPRGSRRCQRRQRQAASPPPRQSVPEGKGLGHKMDFVILDMCG